MNFTEKSLNELLNGGYEKAVGEDKNTFIAFYAYLFDDSEASVDFFVFAKT